MSTTIGDPGLECDPVRVTGWVDGAFAEAEAAAIASHVATCARCGAQVDAERAIAGAVRALPSPPLPHGLAARVRQRSRRPVALRRRVWIPAVAALLAVALWTRSAPQFLAWQVALDHAHCFGMERVPAEVLTPDPVRLATWYESRDMDVPLMPSAAGGLELLGGRFCRIGGRKAAHVYYGGDQQLSLFVIPGSVRFDRSYTWSRKGMTVSFIRVAGENVAIVSPHPPSVAALRRSFERTMADAGRR